MPIKLALYIQRVLLGWSTDSYDLRYINMIKKSDFSYKLLYIVLILHLQKGLRDSVDGEVDVPGLKVILDRSRSLQLPSSSWLAAT